MMRLRGEEGSAMLELALICPVFILLLTGALNFGVALQKSAIVADSARVGAAYALTYGNYTNTTQMQAVATASAAAAKVTNYTATATNFCTCGASGGTVVSCTGLCSGYGQPAMYAQVRATGSIPLLFNGLAALPVVSVARVRIPCPSC